MLLCCHECAPGFTRGSNKPNLTLKTNPKWKVITRKKKKRKKKEKKKTKVKKKKKKKKKIE